MVLVTYTDTIQGNLLQTACTGSATQCHDSCCRPPHSPSCHAELQVTDDDLQAIMVLMDADKDGALSCADFAAIRSSGSVQGARSKGVSMLPGIPGLARLSGSS